MKKLPFWKRPYFSHRVLDIGAGHDPYSNTTHVLEIDPDIGRERGYNKIVVPKKAELTIGNAMALPFKASSFDYVYASHILEHVDSPETACREIMRVGSSGYIETPSPLLEQGLALKEGSSSEDWFHKWFVFSLGNKLVFEPKNTIEASRFCSCDDGQFMREFFLCVDLRDAHHCLRRKATTTIFYWNSAFQIDVRERTVDCRRDGQVCRFRGMAKSLLMNCNDLFRAPRMLHLRKQFPACRDVFKKYGHKTLLIN